VRLHGAAATVVRVVTATTVGTTVPERATVSDDSGSTRNGEQQHLTTHLLTEGPVSGGPMGSPSTRAAHGSSHARWWWS
jgi:hypothetical protein